MAVCTVLAVNATVPRRFACISQLIANGTVKEAFAAFTSEDAIMPARGRCGANCTIDGLLWVVVPVDFV